MFDNRQELTGLASSYKEPKSKDAIHLPKSKYITFSKVALFIVAFSLLVQNVSHNYKQETVLLQDSPYLPKHLKSQSLDDIVATLSPTILEDPTILSLIALATDYPQVKNILANLKLYPVELLELAANKPETINFVTNYIHYLTEGSNDFPISIESDYTEGTVPLFIQWDERWGYENYGPDFIAINGCGPTSLSMVLVGLTGNTDMNPKAVADFSYRNGYLVNGQGSSWALMSEGAQKLGLNSEVISASKSVIYNNLRQGNPIIASMGPGDFTSAGHFIVLTGITEDGKIIVNDSDSIVRSKKSWDIETIMSQAKNLWAFSL